jgi:hypothetical protein
MERVEGELRQRKEELRAYRSVTPKYIGPLAGQAIFAGASLEAGALEAMIEEYLPDVQPGIVHAMIGTGATVAGVFIKNPDARAVVDNIAKAHTGPALFAAGKAGVKAGLKRLESVAASGEQKRRARRVEA